MAKGGALLIELVTVYTAAAGVGIPLARLGLPPVLGYLAVGVALGPQVTGFVESRDAVTGLAEVGVALLLLGVGLEFGTEKLKRLARPMALAGSVQLLGTLGVTMAVAMLVFGLTWPGALALGGIVALSSTAIVLRILQDAGGAGRADGMVATAVLVLQDIAVVPLVLVVEALGTDGGMGDIALAVLRAALALGVAFIGARLIANRVLDAVSRLASAELFLLTVLSVAGAVALVCSLVGLSPALGAFLGGVVIADGRFAHRATREILPLRAVTSCLFFASIGMLVDPAVLMAQPLLILGSVVGIFVLKAVIAALGARLAGLKWGPSARVGLLLAQVGEFSFVLAGAAAASSLLGPSMVQQLTVIIVASMALTALTSTGLDWLPRPAIHTEGPQVPDRVDVVIAGHGVGGSTALTTAVADGRSAVVVERNIDTVAALRVLGVPAVRGDATDPRVLAQAGLDDHGILVIAISDLAAAYATARTAHAHWPGARVLLRVRFEEDAQVSLPPTVEVICEEIEGGKALARALGG